jgi:hypothetical protein
MEFGHLQYRTIGVAAGLVFIATMTAAPPVLRAQTDGSEAGPAATADVSTPDSPEWDMLDDPASDSDSQVLELPKLVETEDGTADFTTTEADDDSIEAPSGNEAGNLSDYLNRSEQGAEVALAPPPPIIYPPVGGWNFVTVPPSSVIIVRPGGLSPIPSTSPLLTTPRGSGPVFGGWWHRVR